MRAHFEHSVCFADKQRAVRSGNLACTRGARAWLVLLQSVAAWTHVGCKWRCTSHSERSTTQHLQQHAQNPDSVHPSRKPWLRGWVHPSCPSVDIQQGSRARTVAIYVQVLKHITLNFVPLHIRVAVERQRLDTEKKCTTYRRCRLACRRGRATAVQQTATSVCDANCTG